MINRDQIIDIVKEVDERFVQEVKLFYEDWSDDPAIKTDGWPHYLLFASLSRVIAKDIRTGKTGPLPAIFNMIERLLVEGDDYTSEAASVGLLEDIQNNMLADNTGLHLAHPFLRSESKRLWDKLILFWDGKVDALQDD